MILELGVCWYLRSVQRVSPGLPRDTLLLDKWVQILDFTAQHEGISGACRRTCIGVLESEQCTSSCVHSFLICVLAQVAELQNPIDMELVKAQTEGVHACFQAMTDARFLAHFRVHVRLCMANR